MRRRLLYSAGGLALTILLISGDPASAADPSARLGRLNCEAGEIAKFDGQRWVCAQDETGDGAPAFVLTDANGEQVGTAIDVPSISQVQVAVALVHPLSGQEITVVLGFWPDEVGIGQLLTFEDPGCAGTPWIPVSEHGFFDVFTPSLVAENGDARPLYVATDDSSLERITIRSELASGGCIERDGVAQVDAVEATLADPDLHQTFPPPYTLELQDGR